jgi:hypothetical protein
MTPFQAMDVIAGMLLNGFSGAIELPNRAFTAPADPVVTFAKATFQHADMAQASLAGGDGTRRYENIGTVTIEMFFPTGIGVERPYNECEAIAALFRGKHSPNGDVWFRDVAINEITQSRITARYQMNVSFTFEYDQFN